MDHDAGYLSEHLLITQGEQTRFDKPDSTRSGGERSTCVADHFGTSRTVSLVRTG